MPKYWQNELNLNKIIVRTSSLEEDDPLFNLIKLTYVTNITLPSTFINYLAKVILNEPT